MNVNLKNENGQVIDKYDIDFDVLMTEAEGKEGDAFYNAVQLLEESIKTKGNYQYGSNPAISIVKYLKKYAAFGQAEEPLVIMVNKRNEERGRMVDISNTVFEEIIAYPNAHFQNRYDRLVGLDDLKNLIQKEGAIIMAPEMLERWSMKHYNKVIEALKPFNDRYPFFIFEGDVGTGKTEFAMTFGNSLAQFTHQEVILARMSMKSRGNGVVGEMSKLISKAFQDAKKIVSDTKKPLIILLDEADSLAQSREENQMHHEDRAGVNALIQGIDHIRNSPIPILTVFCTNRLGAIDPAIKRRAALIHTFSRPSHEQRYDVFRKYYGNLSFSTEELNTLAHLTGENADRSYGFTYSDLLTRAIPQSILDAYPDKPLTFKGIEQVIKSIKPTAPFVAEGYKRGKPSGVS